MVLLWILKKACRINKVSDFEQLKFWTYSLFCYEFKYALRLKNRKHYIINLTQCNFLVNTISLLSWFLSGIEDTYGCFVNIWGTNWEVFNTIEFIVRNGRFFLLYCSYCNIKRKAWSMSVTVKYICYSLNAWVPLN